MKIWMMQSRHFGFFQGANLIVCVNRFLFSYFSAVQDSYFINTLTFQKIIGSKFPLPPYDDSGVMERMIEIENTKQVLN